MIWMWLKHWTILDPQPRLHHTQIRIPSPKGLTEVDGAHVLLTSNTPVSYSSPVRIVGNYGCKYWSLPFRNIMVFHHVLRFFMYQHPAMLPSRSFPWQCRPCHQPTLDLHWLGLQLWLKVPGVASKIGRTWGKWTAAPPNLLRQELHWKVTKWWAT